jgi:transcriptional regulator with XRE-family HTH domain
MKSSQMTTEEAREFHESVGKMVREARSAARLSQNELSELISINRPTLSKLERGDSGLRLMVLYEICTALKLDPIQILPAVKHENTGEAPSLTQGLDLITRGQNMITQGSDMVKRVMGMASQ